MTSCNFYYITVFFISFFGVFCGNLWDHFKTSFIEIHLLQQTLWAQNHAQVLWNSFKIWHFYALCDFYEKVTFFSKFHNFYIFPWILIKFWHNKWHRLIFTLTKFQQNQKKTAKVIKFLLGSVLSWTPCTLNCLFTKNQLL